MMNQELAMPPLAQGPFEGLGNWLGMQTFMYMVANNLPGIRIRYQAQVQRAATGWQVSNVRHPDMLRSCRDDLIGAWFE